MDRHHLGRLVLYHVIQQLVQFLGDAVTSDIITLFRVKSNRNTLDKRTKVFYMNHKCCQIQKVVY